MSYPPPHPSSQPSEPLSFSTTRDHPPAVQARADVDPGVRDDLRFAAVVVMGLAVLGALLGLVWALWSPPGPRALVLAPGVRQPDETEAFVAGDGRYLVIALVVGIAAGVLAWLRRRNRGAVVGLALAVGGLAGSFLTELVGHLTGGGTFDGRPNTLIEQLPLSLHLPALVVIEPAVAVLLYGVIAAFAARDDLARPDAVRDTLRPTPVSVGAGDHPQHGWGDGDTAGPLQQRDLPSQ